MIMSTPKLLFAILLFSLPLCLCGELLAQGPATTTVQDTVYRSDGSLASGSVVISWPSFVTADNKPVFGGTKTVQLSNGALSVALVPTVGATPPGISYTVKYYQAGATYLEQTWVVPSSSGPVGLGQVLVTSDPSPAMSVNSNQVVGTALVASPAATQAVTAPATTGAVPLQLKGNASAAADILDIYNSASSPALTSYFDKNGALNATVASEFENATNPIYPFTSPIQIFGPNTHYEREWHQNRTQTYSAFDNLGFLASEQFALNGGVNALANGYANKTTWVPYWFLLSKWTPGQAYGLQLTQTNYSIGDTLGLLASSTCYGGANAPGDERCEAIDQWALQGIDVFVGTISSGGATGSTSLTISPSAGAGTQGAGRYLIDTTSGKTYSTGIVSSITNGPPVIYTGSGTSWTPSSVWTTASSLSGTTPGTVTITPASMTGISNGMDLVIADQYNIEVCTVSGVTGSTFNCTLEKAHSTSGQTEYISSGKCDNSSTLDLVELVADRQTPANQTLRWAWPVIGCPSSTSMYVWYASTAGWGGYNGAWTAIANTYVLYPAAEITAVNNGGASVSNTLTLATNNAPWTSGDSAEIPHYPAMGVSAGNISVTKYFPSPGNPNSAAQNVGLNGVWSNSDIGYYMVNGTPLSNYKTNSGAVFPPKTAYFAGGSWASGLNMQYAPSETYDSSPYPNNGAAIVLGCTATSNGACSDTAGIIHKAFSGGWDTLNYNESTKSWTLSAGTKYYRFGPTTLGIPGTINTYNGISTVGNGIPAEYGTVDLTSQGANISTTADYAVPTSGAGMYRVSVYVIVTQAATSSSTLPSVTIGWTDKDNNTGQTAAVISTNAGNALTTYGSAQVIVMAKSSTNITYATGGYASSGATSMQYSLHIKVEAM